MKLTTLSLALLAAVCMAAPASAATMTVSNNSNVILSQDTDWNDFLTFAKFNPALGTLTSVSFDLYSTINGSVSLTNYNDDAVTVPFSLGATVALDRPDSSNLAMINAALFATSVSVAGGGGVYSDSNMVTAHASATYSNAADLLLFTGPGSIATLIAANAWSSVSGDGVDAQFATQASGNGTITYTYIAPVPEPETYAMLLLGMSMMGVVVKRKRG